MPEFSLGEASLGTSVDLSGLKSGIDDAETTAKSGFGHIGDVLNGALKVGLTAAVGGFVALSVAIGSGLNDARESAKLMAATQQVISSMGNTAGVSAQHVSDLATSLSDANGMSLFGDDQIQASTNMLLTFGNIKGKVLDLATAMTVDMGQAMKKSPEDMSVMIGKLLNSADAMSAAQRMGVSFSDEQIKLGKHLFDTGHVAEYQMMVLDELGKEYGGQAKAAADAAGPMAQFQARMSEAAETAANSLLPVLDDLFGFLNKSVAPIIEHAAQVFADFVGVFRSGAADGGGFIQGLVSAIMSLDQVSPVFDVIGSAVLGIAEVFSNAADGAYDWGQGIINQLAAGMSQAISSVVATLRGIGSVIASWLQPHSPPKILPNIDDWGQSTAELWVGGFAKADLSAISDFGDSVRSVLSSLSDAGQFDARGIIPAVLGSENAMAAAIQQVDAFGSASDAAIQGVIDSAGAAAPEVAGLVRSYFDLRQATTGVERAQDDLNRTTDAYASRLTPLNAQLKQIQDQKRGIQDQQRLRDLQKEIADGATDDLTRQQDLLEIQEIQARQQIDSVETERDAAIKAQQDKLDAAKQGQDAASAQLEQQKAQIDAQNEQRKLAKDQRDLLKRIADEQTSARKQQQADAVAAAKKAEDEHKHAIANQIEDAKTAEDKLRILRAAQSQTEQGSDAWREYQKQIETIEKQQADAAKRRDEAEWNYRYSIADEAGKLAMLKEKLGGVEQGSEDYYQTLTKIDQIQDSIDKKAEAAANKKGAGGPAAAGGGIPVPKPPEPPKPPGKEAEAEDPFAEAQKRVQEYRDTILGALTTIGGATQVFQGVITAVLDAYQARWDALYGAFQNILPGILALVTAIFSQVQTFMDAHGAEIVAAISTAWNSINDIVNTVITILGIVIGRTLQILAAEITAHSSEIQLVLSAAWTFISTVIQTTLDLISGIVHAVLVGINGDWSTAWQMIQQASAQFVQGAYNAIVAGLNLIAAFFGTSLAGIAQTWTNNFQMLITIAAKVVEDLEKSIGDAVTWIVDTWNSLPNRLAGTGEAIVMAVWDGIKAKWHELVDWFDDKLQELRDKLPFSEPKDKSSPLYGLSDSGAAMVEMIQSGIDSFGNGLPNVFASSLPTGAPATLQAMPSLPADSLALNVNVTISYDDRGRGWLENLIDTKVESKLKAAGDDALSRSRARG